MMLTAFHQLKRQLQHESTREYKARGILVKRCPNCQINPQACICNLRPSLDIDLDILLIFHRDEVFKPSNTGRLIADAFPYNSYAFCWHRKEPPVALLNIINDPSRECVVVFPATPEQNRQLIDKQQLITNTDKQLTLIFLDATWRQARKMFNLSKWLVNCKVLILDPTDKALYSSRKASDEAHLSTAESAALALMHLGREFHGEALHEFFVTFNKAYSDMRSNR